MGTVEIDLNNNDTLIRKLSNSEQDEPKSIVYYNIEDFKHQETWELWQEDGSLYFRAFPISAEQSFGDNHYDFKVIFEVIGEPQRKTIRQYSDEELIEELEYRLKRKF